MNSSCSSSPCSSKRLPRPAAPERPWAYWNSHAGDSFGPIASDCTEAANADLLVRTYPRRIAGRPIEYGFDPDSRVFRRVFEQRGTVKRKHRRAVKGPTKIYIPERRHDPEGFRIFVHGNARARRKWNAEREIASVWTRPKPGKREILVQPADAPEPEDGRRWRELRCREGHRG